MIPVNKRAANLLVGKVLQGGWTVIKKLNDDNVNTYSACYLVQSGSKHGFLKAFDYSAANRIGVNSMDQILDLIKAFKFEKTILEKCAEKNCKNIIEILDDGEIEVEEAEKYPKVHYLILEYSEKGAIDKIIDKDYIDLRWKLKSIHQIAKGLSQLHEISIAHQDLKPENVVVFDDNTKITDLGSAIDLASDREDIPKLFDNDYNGTWEFAPPELLYGELSENNVIRRIGCDLYLLGSMIAFYFTGYSMTALIRGNLADNLSWVHRNNHGKYNDVKSYVINAFHAALGDIDRSIQDEKLNAKVIEVVTYLCNPDPLERGHKKTITANGKNYNLERFISIFDWMEKYLAIKSR